MYDYAKERSKRILHNHSDLIFEQGCYDNAYRMLSEGIDELKPASKVSVLFCYLKGERGRYYRHVFCLYDGAIVEPLLYFNLSAENRAAIIPIRLIPSVQEYLGLAEKDGETDLRDSLYQDELRVVRETGIFRILNPLDLARLYRDTSGDAPYCNRGHSTE